MSANSYAHAHRSAQTSRRRSPLMRFLVIALILLMTPIFALGATVAATGVATVQISEAGPDGVNLWIPVPALLFDVAVAAVPRFLPEHELDDARREVAPYLPMLRDLADAIEDMPSATFVEVESGSEHVRIMKEGRNFKIHVESPDANVRVTVPARLFGRSLDILG